jgi:molybdenum cofactor cytidylyltransferase
MVLAAVRHAVDAVGTCLVVMRPDDHRIAALLHAEPGVRLCRCPGSGGGMGHSIACGVAATPQAPGWLIILGDMPCLDPRTIGRVAASLAAGAAIVQPVYRGRPGHPVGFSSEFRTRLCRLTGDRGARGLIAAQRHRVVRLPVADPGILWDIDTPADVPAP